MQNLQGRSVPRCVQRVSTAQIAMKKQKEERERHFQQQKTEPKQQKNYSAKNYFLKTKFLEVP